MAAGKYLRFAKGVRKELISGVAGEGRSKIV